MIAAKELLESFVGTTFAGPPPKGLLQLPSVARVSPRVVRVLGLNPSAFTLQGTNTYLVGTGKKRWLIDTAEGRRGYAPLLEQAMKDEGVEGLEGVILTHWHFDHVGGLPSVRKLFGNEVKAYKKVRHDKGEVEIADDGTRIGGKSGAQYHEIRDGDVFETEGATLRALFTPGHTEDHMCFVLEEEGAMFAGDCVLNGQTASFEDLRQYTNSLQRMLDELQELRVPLGDPKRLYPSHGAVIEDGLGKLKEYLTHRKQREEIFRGFIMQHPHDGLTAWELTQATYGNTVPKLVLYTACYKITQQHLMKMVEEGQVREVKELGWWGNEQARYFPAYEHLDVKKEEEEGDDVYSAARIGSGQPDFA